MTGDKNDVKQTKKKNNLITGRRPTPARPPSHLADRHDEEGPASSGFDDDGDELGVDGTEGVVPRHPGHSDVVDAVLGFPRLRKDVAELALTDHASAERHDGG